MLLFFDRKFHDEFCGVFLCFFFRSKMQPWRIGDGGKMGERKPRSHPIKTRGDCEMTIRGEIKGRQEAAAGLVGNGGWGCGGEGWLAEKGEADSAQTPLPPPPLRNRISG